MLLAVAVRAAIAIISGLVIMLLSLRVVLVLTGIQLGGLADAVARLSAPLLEPFHRLVGLPSPSVDGFIFDLTAMLAVLVYSLLASGLIAILNHSLRQGRPRRPAA